MANYLADNEFENQPAAVDETTDPYSDIDQQQAMALLSQLQGGTLGGSLGGLGSYLGSPSTAAASARYAPQYAMTQAAQQAVTKPASSPWGIAAAALGGAMLGGQNNQYNQQAQALEADKRAELQGLADIVSGHDKQYGIDSGHDITLQSLRQMLPKMKHKENIDKLKILMASYQKKMPSQVPDLTPSLYQAFKNSASGEPVNSKVMAYLESKDPATAMLVKGMGELDFDATKRFGGLSSGDQGKYLSWAKLAYPGFDAMKSRAVQQIWSDAQSYKPNTIGGQAASINTISDHFGMLQADIDKMHNGQITPANAVINWARNITGRSDITDIKTATLNVNQELEKLLGGASATVEGLKHRLEAIGPNASPEQLDNWVLGLMDTIQPRISELENKWRNTFKGTPKEDIYAAGIINPNAVETMNNIKEAYVRRHGARVNPYNKEISIGTAAAPQGPSEQAQNFMSKFSWGKKPEAKKPAGGNYA